ncbi:MAG: hypothetical protein AAFN70_03250, partial [Planctomycetota bacterium]
IDKSSTTPFPVFFDAPGLTLSVHLSSNGSAETEITSGVTVTDRGNGIYWITPVASHRSNIGETLWRITDGTDTRLRVEQIRESDGGGSQNGTETTIGADAWCHEYDGFVFQSQTITIGDADGTVRIDQAAIQFAIDKPIQSAKLRLYASLIDGANATTGVSVRLADRNTAPTQRSDLDNIAFIGGSAETPIADLSTGAYTEIDLPQSLIDAWNQSDHANMVLVLYPTGTDSDWSIHFDTANNAPEVVATTANEQTCGLTQAQADQLAQLHATTEDHSGTRRFTAAALALTPSSGGGGMTPDQSDQLQIIHDSIGSFTEDDADSGEKRFTAIALSQLGVDMANEVAKAIRPFVLDSTLPSIDNSADVISFSIYQRDDYEGDTGVIGPIRLVTPLPLEEAASRLRFGATYRSGSRFNRETGMFIGRAIAVPVAGENDTWDVSILIDKAELNKPAGRYGWDVEWVKSNGEVRTITSGWVQLIDSMGDNEDRDPLN